MSKKQPSLGTAPDLRDVPSTSAADVVRKGWLDRLMRAGGKLAVRDDHRVKAVLLDVDQYRILRAAADLAEQQRRETFLQSPEGAEQLRAMTRDLRYLDDGIKLGPAL